MAQDLPVRLRAVAQGHGGTGTLEGHVGVLLASYISVNREQNSQEKLIPKLHYRHSKT